MSFDQMKRATRALLLTATVALGLLPTVHGQGTATEDAPTTAAQANSEWPEQAPENFKVRFETTAGVFVAEFHKEWAPIGVSHFYDLLRKDFYDGAKFFRVVPGFIVQFGIAADPEVTATLGEQEIKDDPVKQSNQRGIITFAKTQMPNSRSSQLFINLRDNSFLDNQRFAPIGEVIEGMESVEAITAEYGERPSQELITRQGNAYLEKNFPGMDGIVDAVLIQDEAGEAETQSEDTATTE